MCFDDLLPLRSPVILIEQSEGGLQTMLHTRVVSRILLRVGMCSHVVNDGPEYETFFLLAIWRQQHFRPHKPLPTLNGHRYAVPRQRRPLRRALFDFVISCLCLGIPYLFFERGRQSRIDEESGVRSTGPMMFLVCAGASLIVSSPSFAELWSIFIFAFSRLQSS